MNIGLIPTYSTTDKNKRKPISKGFKQLILDAQSGKCKECGRSFKQLGLKPHYHHKSMNTNNNSPSNLIAICPNCHNKIHQTLKKKTIKIKDALGFVYGTKIKVVREKKKGHKPKQRKKRKPKNPYSIYSSMGNYNPGKIKLI